MKVKFSALIVLLLNMAGMPIVCAQGNAPTGAINGLFSVSEGTQVYFSQGNLQYIGSAETPYWKFADHQWDYLGTTTGQNSDSQTVDRDLFGWGTSGYHDPSDPYNVNYQPWSTSNATVSTDYNKYGYGPSTNMADPNLTGSSANYDWGVYNAISNGGDQAGLWRTPTHDEWSYLINTRNTASGIRYAKAKVNDVNGVILLPDDWSTSYYALNSTDTNDASFSSNTITAAQWNTLEQHGAVFLPAAGRRYGASVNFVGSSGYYWSASYLDSYIAWHVRFGVSNLSADYNGSRYHGLSVRLVCVAQGYSFVIDATPSPAEGGAVSGAGTYEAGAECTLTATASAGYTFVNWTENGEEVSTDATYTFTVSSDRDLVANFMEITNYWEPNIDGYEDYMVVIGVVQINGVEQASTTLELAAFCGDECRGTTLARYFPPKDRYLYLLSVYGNSSNSFTFKLFDHEQQQELPLVSPDAVAYQENGYGRLADPYILNFTTPTVLQQVTLSTGWNWFSSYIDLGDPVALLDMLKDALDDNALEIQSYDDNTECMDGEWFGGLDDIGIDNARTYMILAANDCTIEMEGPATDPANYPITLHRGWNWIGFPCSQEVSVADAFAGFEPEEGDVLQSYDNMTEFDGEDWWGELETLVPGQGLMYYSMSDEPKVLVIQIASRKSSKH